MNPEDELLQAFQRRILDSGISKAPAAKDSAKRAARAERAAMKTTKAMGDFDMSVACCVAFGVISGAHTEGTVKQKADSMKVFCVWAPKRDDAGNVIKQYRDDVYCPTHGCTWERVYKFRVGDLAQDAASVAALDDMERWYTDSKYGDAEFVAPDTPHAEYKGLPFKKLNGGNDKAIVVRDDLPGGAEKYAFAKAEGVRNINPRTAKEEQEEHRRRVREGRDVHDSESDSE